MKSESYYIPQNGIKNSANQPYSFELNKLAQEKARAKYATFVENTKLYLLSEALYSILSECVSTKDSEFTGYGRALCEGFVQEEGYEKLMSHFRTSTNILANLEQCVKDNCNSIIGKADKENPLTFTILSTDQEKFFDSLKSLDFRKATKKINERVCNATEEFIQKNINTKLDIEELASKTKERIDAAKEKNDDKLAEVIQKEQMLTFKRESENIKKRPIRNVYEQMMNSVSACILEDEERRTKFTNESGQFDMAKIDEQVQVMYTFLEMVNSLKIKKVTNKYIEECLTSIA